MKHTKEGAAINFDAERDVLREGSIAALAAERDRLRAANEELVKALQNIYEIITRTPFTLGEIDRAALDIRGIARAAIAKEKEGES